MRCRVACSVVFAVSLLLPSLSQAQGLKANLENPAPNSFQSGIGVLLAGSAMPSVLTLSSTGRVT